MPLVSLRQPAAWPTAIVLAAGVQAHGGLQLHGRHGARDALNEVFGRRNFYLDSWCRASPRLTLTLTESYIVSVNTNLVSTSGGGARLTRST